MRLLLRLDPAVTYPCIWCSSQEFHMRGRDWVMQQLLASPGTVLQDLGGLEKLLLDVEIAPEGQTLDDITLRAMVEAMARHGGRRVAVCRELGINQSTLYRRLREKDSEGVASGSATASDVDAA